MQINTSAYNENIYSFVNNINTIEGGTHLEGFKRSLTKVFNDYARSHNILKDKELLISAFECIKLTGNAYKYDWDVDPVYYADITEAITSTNEEC